MPKMWCKYCTGQMFYLKKIVLAQMWRVSLGVWVNHITTELSVYVYVTLSVWNPFGKGFKYCL